MDWMLMPIRRYADFNGRSRRREYWMFALFYWLASAILFAAGSVFGAMAADGGADTLNGGGIMTMLVVAVWLIFAAALFVPSVAVLVRRLHDQDQSGWMVLLGLIPAIGGLILLVFALLPGTAGPNRYGPDPKASEPGRVAAI